MSLKSSPRRNGMAVTQPLESRRLLSHAGVEIGSFGGGLNDPESFEFADPDGTRVVVSLRGGGAGHLYSDGQHVDLELNDTGPRSRLVVRAHGGGDGRPTFHDLVVNGSLASVAAPTTDVTGDISVTGSMLTIRIGDLGGPVSDPSASTPERMLTIAGAGTQVTLAARSVEELGVVSASPFRAIRVSEWLDGGGAPNRISAPSIGSLRAETWSQGLALSGTGARGPSLGSVRIGSLSGAWAVQGDGGSVRAVYARNWSASFGGRLGQVSITQRVPPRGPPLTVSDVDLAARSVGKVSIRTNVARVRVLAGADFGADGRLGGTGADADAFGPGDVGRVTLGRWPQWSVVAAGLNPVNGVLFDGDDVLLGGGRIGAVSIGGGLESQDTIRIVAAELPEKVRTGRTVLRPSDGDPRFTLMPMPQ